MRDVIVATCVLLCVVCAAGGLRWMLRQHDDAPPPVAPDPDVRLPLDELAQIESWNALDEIQLIRLLARAAPPPGDH